jgi:uncharacterized protein (DUF58 family)
MRIVAQARVLATRLRDYPAVRAAARLRDYPAVKAVTGLGWIVIVISVVAWIVGAYFGWIELTLGAVTGGFVVIGCIALTIGRTALQIEIDPGVRRMTVGAMTTVTVTITNLAPRRLLMLAIEVAVGHVPQPVDAPANLPGGEHFATAFEIRGERRGVIPVGPASSVRGDPLGLIRRRVTWAEATEIFIHPRTARLESFGAGLLRDLEGRTTEDVSMSDLAFHTLREYVPGDDRRYIHWRSSAKASSTVDGGKFLVRQFRDTRRTHLLVIVDGTASAYDDPDSFETAISVGASVALRATADELDATLVVADQPTSRLGGRAGTANRVLDTFARAELGGRDLAALVGTATRTAPEATYAFIITGSNVSFRNLRRVASQLPQAVRTTVVRIDPDARPGVASVASPTVLTLSALEDLRGLLARREAVR